MAETATSSMKKKKAAAEPKPTAFGRMVGSINAENELWMALVLTRYIVKLSSCRMVYVVYLHAHQAGVLLILSSCRV